MTTTVTWINGNGDFNDTGHWKLPVVAAWGVGDSYPDNAHGNEYAIRFDNTGAVTVHVNVDAHVRGIEINGNTQLTLVFDNGKTLGDTAVGTSLLTFNQANGATTSLTLDVSTGATSGQLGIDAINVAGDAGGNSALVVKNHTLAAISGDLVADARKFNLTIDSGGDVEAANVSLGRNKGDRIHFTTTRL